MSDTPLGFITGKVTIEGLPAAPTKSLNYNLG